MTKDQLIEDLRTDQEKRQDAFDSFLTNAILGQKARIAYCGHRCTVMYAGVSNGIVSLDIIKGKKNFNGIGTISFSLGLPQDAELIKIS